MVNRKIIIISGCLLVGVFVWVALSKDRKDSFKSSHDFVSKNNSSAQKLYEEANHLKNSGEWLNAKEIYQKIMTESPDFQNMEAVQKELGDLNMQILFSNTVTPKTVMHEVAVGDTLGKIAAKYNTTVDFVKLSNNISNNVIRVGQKLRIYKGNFSVLVDKSQNVLLLKDGDEVLKVYHVSTGKNNSTPVGKYSITSKLIDPVWFNKGVVVPPESPANVLGTRWLGFDLAGYGIHGTIDPEAIGQQATAGCVRMRNEDVEQIYVLLPIGTQVVIVD